MSESETLKKLREEKAREDHIKRQRAELVSCPDCRMTMEPTIPPDPPGVVVKFRSKSGEKQYAMRLVVSRDEIASARGYDPLLEAKRRVRHEQGAAEACRCSGTGFVLQSLMTDMSDDLPARARQLDNHERNVRAEAAKEVRARRAWVEKFHADRADIRCGEVLDWLMELADEIQGNSP